MRTIIAGSRDATDIRELLSAIKNCSWEITQVVCGMARGADMLGFTWAGRMQIPVVKFPANWDLYGKLAGYRRNVQMAENADALIALWDGKSRGTGHMIDVAQAKKLKLLIHHIKP